MIHTPVNIPERVRNHRLPWRVVPSSRPRQGEHMQAVTDNDPATLNALDVCRIAGITYRQLDYWIRVGAITPAQQADGSGTQRRFTTGQARAIRLAATLRTLGAPIATIGAVAGQWADMPEHEWTGTLIVNHDGTTVPGGTSGWILDLELLAATA